MPRTVGIDLGTTYSLIAYQDKRDGRPMFLGLTFEPSKG